MKCIQIDGAFGEGGGQVLRTSLGLSLVTGVPVRIERIRANRRKPGLGRQHLTAVRAAKKLGRARVKGMEIGSRRLEFAPQVSPQPGDYTFDVGTAGSCTLVLQTILPALLTANAPSRIVLKGGTHNPFAPPFDFFAHSFTPVIRKMGAGLKVELHRRGFYPKGGGEFTASIEPAELQPIHLPAEQTIHRVAARAVVVRLDRNIGQREIDRLQQRLALDDSAVVEDTHSLGPANVLLLAAEGETLTETMIAFGERGRRAEVVADGLADEFERYQHHGAPVSEHLADQLLIPMALAGGGSFTTGPLSLHTTTNMEMIRKFLDVRFNVTDPGERGRVTLAVEKR